MAEQNKLMQYLQMAQSTGGSPYDEDAYLPQQRSPVNQFLNNRLQQRMQPQPSGGSDMDMMMKYGPEDQVAFDNMGQPIPLADPRHPRNQQQNYQTMAPSYPQRR